MFSELSLKSMTYKDRPHKTDIQSTLTYQYNGDEES